MPLKTLFIGQTKFELISVDSTNNYALDLLKTSYAKDGTLVFAHEQTNGRGQRGNQWISAPNVNLTFSLIVFPKLSLNEQFYLTKMTSVSLIQLIHEFSGSEEAQIKWPNDIYIGNQKVGGILIENSIKGSLIASSVIGIGLNVNQTLFSKDTPQAASLQSIYQRSFDLQLLLNRACELIEANYLNVIAGNVETINSMYFNFLYCLNKWRRFENEEGVFKGMIVGVSEDGKLQLINEENALMEFTFKSVSLLGE